MIMKCRQFIKKGNKYRMEAGSIVFSIRMKRQDQPEEMRKVIHIQSKINRDIYRMERRNRAILLKAMRKKRKAI